MGPETRVSLTTASKRKSTGSKAQRRRPARRPSPPVHKARPTPKRAPKRPATKVAAKPAVKAVAKPSVTVAAKSHGKTSARPPSAPTSSTAPLRPGDSRAHLLSLSFLRDGDEFMARLETDAGQITELKNRSLDQLLTLVAGELEDLLE